MKLLLLLLLLETYLSTADVEVELQDIKDAAAASRSTKVNPWRAIFSRKFAPQLVTIVALQVFNQLDGINSIMFYAPQASAAADSRQSILCSNLAARDVETPALACVPLCVSSQMPWLVWHQQHHVLRPTGKCSSCFDSS
jgi:hypothetical protein